MALCRVYTYLLFYYLSLTFLAWFQTILYPCLSLLHHPGQVERLEIILMILMHHIRRQLACIIISVDQLPSHSILIWILEFSREKDLIIMMAGHELSVVDVPPSTVLSMSFGQLVKLRS